MSQVLIISNSTITLKIPAPTQVADYRLVFTWFELEEKNGNMPAEADHVGKIGIIALHYTTTIGGNHIFSGKHPKRCHPAKNVSVTDNEHGFSFDVVCINRNRCVANHIFWSSYMSRRTLTRAINNDVLSVTGECSFTWNEQAATIMLNQTGGIDRVEISFSAADFDLFHHRLVEKTL
jgi:hypothetical protein